MNWKKLGLIFNTESNQLWNFSHAANPVPYIIDKDLEIVRVFYTTRSQDNRSFISYSDFNFKNDFKLIRSSVDPILAPGEIGSFDDSGTAMGYLIEFHNKYYLFYLGWNLKVTVPWLNSIGLAVSESLDGPFKKLFRSPVMDRSHEDPFSISYPSILRDDNKFKMWYGSNLSWGDNQLFMQHVIKYAESDNLIDWFRTNQIHIPLIHQNEYAISKPWVILDGGIYKMWYSHRGIGNIKTYRIGYAESVDGVKWIRMDNQVGINISTKKEWDSEMICYPSVFSLNDKTYMLYNGNGYGKTGFGIAILQK
jgi:hypothetical protein